MSDKLLRLIYDQGFRFSEEATFKLASGKMSNFYIDCRVVNSLAAGKYFVSQMVYDKIASLDIKAIGGPALGAIPIADAVSYLSFLVGKDVSSFWIRKEPKGHGLKKWIDGNVASGDRVVIVDDVITTGQSTIDALQRAREAGLEVVKVVVMVDRQEDNGRQNIEKEGVEVEALYTINDLMKLRTYYQ
nr:orotate phosphoribosyltransferase [Deltaproteobacteria bacterium]